MYMTGSNDRDELYTTNCRAYFKETAVLFKYLIMSFHAYLILSRHLFHRKENRCVRRKRAVPRNLSRQLLRAGKYLAFLCILT